ncbi:GAF domain-containing protein [Salinactinospora qingdaonensis]|uniref:PAS domain-containing protein n=1 Tax=Salinactinospora qingdaonensis TaxID=702744 RepID=A0ABP7FYZ1_9ACTN
MAENLTDLEREITDLSGRITALRDTHATYPGEAASTADAALAELGFAEELLRACAGRLSSGENDSGKSGGTPRRSSADEERAVLRAVFTQLSVPVALLDHEGYIRRVNTLGAQRLGSASGYLTGKPFAIFVDLRSRAAMRSWLATVLRGGEPVSFDSRLARRGWAEDVRLTLSRLDVPTETNPLVLVVVSPTLEGGDEGPAPLEPEVEEQVVVLAARRLDVLTRMTRLLLRSAGPDGGGSGLALDEAAELLADSYADWVVLDLCDVAEGAQQARRAVVAGPSEGEHRALVQELDPLASELVREVLSGEQSQLYQLIDDETLLGRTPDGVPLLSVLGAGSLMCVPLRAHQEVRGALTLIRRSNRGSFRLADLGLIEEIGEHIGLALPPPPTG